MFRKSIYRVVPVSVSRGFYPRYSTIANGSRNTSTSTTSGDPLACQTDNPELKHLSEKLDYGFKRIDDQLAQMDQIVKRVDEHLSKSRVESTSSTTNAKSDGYKYNYSNVDNYNSFLVGSIFTMVVVGLGFEILTLQSLARFK